MKDQSLPARADLAGPGAFGSQRGRIGFVLLLAALLAIPVIAVTWMMKTAATPWLLIAAALLCGVAILVAFTVQLMMI